MDWLAQILDLSHLIDGLFVPCRFVILAFFFIAMWWKGEWRFPIRRRQEGAIGIPFPPSPSLPLWLCSSTALSCEGSGPHSEKGLDSSIFISRSFLAPMTAIILCVSMPLLFVQVLIVWQYRTHVLSWDVGSSPVPIGKIYLFPSLPSKMGIELQQTTDRSLQLTRLRAIDFTLAHFVRYFLREAQQA